MGIFTQPCKKVQIRHWEKRSWVNLCQGRYESWKNHFSYIILTRLLGSYSLFPHSVGIRMVETTQLCSTERDLNAELRFELKVKRRRFERFSWDAVVTTIFASPISAFFQEEKKSSVNQLSANCVEVNCFFPPLPTLCVGKSFWATKKEWKYNNFIMVKNPSSKLHTKSI